MSMLVPLHPRVRKRLLHVAEQAGIAAPALGALLLARAVASFERQLSEQCRLPKEGEPSEPAEGGAAREGEVGNA
jgi:hypothetical protein